MRENRIGGGGTGALPGREREEAGKTVPLRYQCVLDLLPPRFLLGLERPGVTEDIGEAFLLPPGPLR